MIQSYDFLVYAWYNIDFREQILAHINGSENSEMTYRSALLKFDVVNKKIIELPLEGAMFSCKVFPMEISFDAFLAVCESDDPWVICEKECKFFD